MDWQAALRTLRPQLPRGREAWGVRGSLRWLEEAMKARGASSSSVRNIVYRDIGTAADKAALHGLLTELAAQVGVSIAPLPASLRSPLPTELELLGRQKRRAFRQFLASVRQGVSTGRGARLIVSGPAGAGKTLLSTHLERAILQQGLASGVHRLTLGGDVGPLFDGLDGAQTIASSQPFAVQAGAQAQAARRLLEGLPQGGQGGVLLLRVLTFQRGLIHTEIGISGVDFDQIMHNQHIDGVTDHRTCRGVLLKRQRHQGQVPGVLRTVFRAAGIVQIGGARH